MLKKTLSQSGFAGALFLLFVATILIGTSLPATAQVSRIRQDAWANVHRIPLEEQKNPREGGHHIHPELYSAPEEAGIQWARHPKMMKRMKEMRRQSRLPVSTARVANRAAPVKR